MVAAYGAEALVEDLAHPGGNITGLSSMLFDLASKHLQSMKEYHRQPVDCSFALQCEREDVFF